MELFSLQPFVCRLSLVTMGGYFELFLSDLQIEVLIEALDEARLRIERANARYLAAEKRRLLSTEVAR
jgi:hypothetical protein